MDKNTQFRNGSKPCMICIPLGVGRVHCGKEKGHEGDCGDWCKRCT